jgi:sporulation protein YlmC with PRC-barrel domain
MAEFILGTRASCSDGPAGEVTRVILDPATRSVTHLVIDPGHDPGHEGEVGRLVPLDLVAQTAGQITLSCTRDEFGRLDPAEDVELAEGSYGGGYGGAASVQGYGNVGSMGVGGSSSGLGIGMGTGHHQRTFVTNAVPLGEAEVARHEHVHALDGEIGQVEGFVVDPGSHQVTHVLLQEGHLWGRKEVAIPISAVTAVDEGIRLNLTKQQVADLPPVS